jgi:hypothetical protein
MAAQQRRVAAVIAGPFAFRDRNILERSVRKDGAQGAACTSVDAYTQEQCFAKLPAHSSAPVISDPFAWSTSKGRSRAAENFSPQPDRMPKTAKRREGRRCVPTCMRPDKYVDLGAPVIDGSRARRDLNADTIREMHRAFREGGRAAINKVMKQQPAVCSLSCWYCWCLGTSRLRTKAV